MPHTRLAGNLRIDSHVNSLAGATDLPEFHRDSLFWPLEKKSNEVFLSDSSTTISTASF